MSIRLARFEMPNRLVKDETTATDTYAKFIAEPFERGYGHTIGNSLRRVLLSSLEGAAITSRQDQGRAARVLHPARRGRGRHRHRAQPQEGEVPATSRTRSRASSPSTSTRKASSPPATSRTTSSYDVVNKDQVICTLDHKVKFEAELEVTRRPRLRHRRREQAPGHADRRHRHRLHLLARHPREIRRGEHPRRPEHRLRQARSSRSGPTAASARRTRSRRPPPSSATTSTSSSTTTTAGRVRRRARSPERGEPRAAEAAQHDRQRDRTLASAPPTASTTPTSPPSASSP